MTAVTRPDIWCPRACRSGLDACWFRSDGVNRAYPVERCRVPRSIRWCPHVLVVVARLGANDADAGRHLGDNQSDCGPRSSGLMQLNEPIAINLVLVLLLVAIGILVASSTSKETAVRVG